MTDRSDIDALAAEYVLGTLDAAERTAVAARRQREPGLDLAIRSWDQRLAPLDDLTAPAKPPANLFGKIEERIAFKTVLDAGGAAVVPMDIAALQRRVRRWRTSAIAASAMAASLAVAFGACEYGRQTMPQSFVAVFQKDDASPSFLMSVDLNTRTLSVRRVAAEVPEGKTYQLWIASDKLGVGPQSLGLVEDQNTAVKNAIAAIDPAIVQSALFGVSLEPAGGSPTGKPTGPVFHARLIATAQ